MLRLDVADYANERHWRWVLSDSSGVFLEDHIVDISAEDDEYRGFVDPYSYIRWNTLPGNEDAAGPRPIERIARWVRTEIWGAVGDKILALAEQGPVTVSVGIGADSEPLLFLPLELGLVLDPSPAALDASLVFEIGDRAKPPEKRAVGDRLRMLAMFSMPTDQAALDVRRERRELARLVHRVARTAGRAVELRILQYGVTRELLSEVLEEDPGWDLIHFSGHGLPAGLVLEHEDGSADVVNSAELAELLWPGRGQLKLVTLFSCESGAAEAAHTLELLGVERAENAAAATSQTADVDIAPLPAVAGILTGRLGCATLAMRYPVEDEFAIELSADLYEGLLAKDQTLARALQRALAKASDRAGNSAAVGLSLATPALYGGAAADLRLAPPTGEPTTIDVSRARFGWFPPEPENFVGRVGPLARASAALAPKSRYRGVIFHGMAGAGKTACALELAFRHRDQRFEAMAWYQAPVEGMDVSGALASFAVALQAQVSGLEIAHLINDTAQLEMFMPSFRQILEERSLLVVLDNVESLLTDDGSWRDSRWALFAEAFRAQDGLSRLVITSRVPPRELALDERLTVEAVHSLSAGESALLARQLPNLRSLILGSAGIDVSEGRALARRTLEVAQGNPKLLELADAQAKDPASLLSRLGEAWSDQGKVGAFFATGEPDADLGAEDFLQVIERWTLGVQSNLTEAERLAFQILCCLERIDRVEVKISYVWLRLWEERFEKPEPPDLESTLAAVSRQGLIDIVEVGEKSGRIEIHPAIAQAARETIDDTLATAVDQAMADLLTMVYREVTESNDTAAAARFGLATAPYLLRTGSPELAAHLLDAAITADPSVQTLAAALPLLEQAAKASEGTPAELTTRAALATARATQNPDLVHRESRDLAELAVKDRDLPLALELNFRQVNSQIRAGHLRAAWETLDVVESLVVEGEFGPWTRLAVQERRLTLMQEEGKNEAVLEEIEALRDGFEKMEAEDGPDLADSADVRDALFRAAFWAAMERGEWERALEWSGEIKRSLEERKASLLVRAMAAFNEFGPLLELGRHEAAEAVLKQMRGVLESSGDLRGLGEVFGTWALLERSRGNLNEAIEWQHKALRMSYPTRETHTIATHHHNLGNNLGAKGEPAEGIAHHVASAMIRLQTESGGLRQAITVLALAAQAEGLDVFPDSFDAVCDVVEQIDGVEYRALFEELPKRVPDGDAAFETVRTVVLELMGDGADGGDTGIDQG